jgi:hypothetical protein
MGDENGVGEPCRRHSRISGAIFAQIFFRPSARRKRRARVGFSAVPTHVGERARDAVNAISLSEHCAWIGAARLSPTSSSLRNARRRSLRILRFCWKKQGIEFASRR